MVQQDKLKPCVVKVLSSNEMRWGNIPSISQNMVGSRRYYRARRMKMKKTKDEDLDKEPTNEAMQCQMKKERGFITFVLAPFAQPGTALP